MQNLDDKKIKIIHRNGQSVSGLPAPKKRVAFFGFFSFPRTQTLGKNTATTLKESLPKVSPRNIPRTDLAAVRNWVALEEKIVHDYKEQKTVQSKHAVPLVKASRLDIHRADLTAVRNWVALEEKIVRGTEGPKTLHPKLSISWPKNPAKQFPPAFETFSTQTVVSSSSSAPQLKTPPPGFRKTFLKLAESFLLLMGWLAAGAFVLLYVQETSLNREASQKISELQNGKKQIEQSYVALKNVSADQSAEIKWLDSELQDTALELKTAKSEIAALQDTVRTQSAVVNALKAQNRAFEKIVDQGGMSALSGAAAGFSQKRFSTGGTFMLQGEVTSVNERQGSVVINMGASQGAYLGRWITISRDGRGLAVGRIERAYPTMSVAVLRSSGMLQAIQEGDSVFFS
jgi:hypothetical protein